LEEGWRRWPFDYAQDKFQGQRGSNKRGGPSAFWQDLLVRKVSVVYNLLLQEKGGVLNENGKRCLSGTTEALG